MPLQKPESVDECVYFTQRTLGDRQQGYAMVWVFRQHCPKCKKGIMGKPRGKDGSVKVRAKEYECPECHYIVPKQEYEETLTASVEYTCPACSFNGEKQVPFKRKKVEGVDALRVQCDKCKAGMDITKKMKDRKSKESFSEDD
ncbi:hypothetical protein HYY74_00685 [Candidatus Woesearchaeota archaeon]|nr:hypothetical protein [Candidatus Woesearchaeota archaeon]